MTMQDWIDTPRRGQEPVLLGLIGRVLQLKILLLDLNYLWIMDRVS